MSTANQETHTVTGTIGAWWRNWVKSRAALAELSALESSDLSGVARDVGINPQELRTLAGKWPDSADLLSQRLEAIRLDSDAVRQSGPGILQDLQRVCAQCSEKQQCGHDIDRDPAGSQWRSYCPNVETLEALELARSVQRLGRKHRA